MNELIEFELNDFGLIVGDITTTGRRLDRENLTEHILEVNSDPFRIITIFL